MADGFLVIYNKSRVQTKYLYITFDVSESKKNFVTYRAIKFYDTLQILQSNKYPFNKMIMQFPTLFTFHMKL